MKRDRTLQSGQLHKIWGPEDYTEFERHVADAVALTKAVEHAKAIHPATVSKQLHAVAEPEPTAEARPCTVTDLFTRSRVR